MKSYFSILITGCVILFSSCTTQSTDQDIENPTDDTALYFPPINSNDWTTSSLTELGWNENALAILLSYLEEKDTKAFIILKNGKLVVESYMSGHSENTNWYWASAGKTLTAFTLGIAQYEGFLNLNDTSANYLGNGWSSLTEGQENEITVAHHITMTTGLNYNLDDTFCTDKECLTYLNPPGDYWYYYNGPYTLTQSIISAALNSDFDTYFNEKLRDPIGMQGSWFYVGYNRLYFSTARSMARFGLLCLNNGIWDSNIIMEDSSYFSAMVNTSQNLNEAYGYLWWLNGKNSFRLPGYTTSFEGKLIPNAPSDLIAGLGANDQKLYVVPSQDLVIVRLGNDAGDNNLSVSGFDNTLWEKINAVIN